MKTKLLFLAVLSISLQSLAWGPIGHASIGKIAEANLSPAANAAVARLLGTETLSSIASWADSLRSGTTYTQTIWYHFEKISDNVSYLDNLKGLPDWQKQKGGVVAAILLANKILRDPTKTQAQQADALKFLVHFTGDIHQPFHTGRPDDNGAVKINMTWMGTPTDLHAVWDSGMLLSGHSDMLNKQIPTAVAATNYSKYLAIQFATLVVNTGFDVEAWLNESMAIRVAGYDPMYNTDQQQYQSLHLPEIDLRIYSAGVRLAQLLNDIYANQAVPAKELDLTSNIEAILGPLDQAMSFSP